MKTRCLANKTKQWFNETQGTGPLLQYRFTGKDSRSFCHNVMTLIKCLTHESDSKKENQTVLVLGYLGLRLRDCVSLCNRFDITLDQIAQLSNASQEYFNLNALFMYTSVNPTVWTMGHIQFQLIVAKYLKNMAAWELSQWKGGKPNIFSLKS